MEGLAALLDAVRTLPNSPGSFRGLLHVLIGRRISTRDGTVISVGLTWRQAATLLRLARWDKDAVRELGLDPAALPPRDRERFWYSAIAQAQVDTPTAKQAGDALADQLVPLGYVVSGSR